jgi:arabinogalactan endo-1,4-beta-galactosidase
MKLKDNFRFLIALVGLTSAPGTQALTPVTFQVDMSVQTALGNFTPGVNDVTVAGDAINDWNAAASRLTNSVAQTKLYVGTFNVTNTAGSTVRYKYTINSGGRWEDNGIGPGGAQNRQFTLASTPQTLPVVFFNNISNLNSTPVTFQVDMSVQIALGSFNPGAGEQVTVAGDLVNNWSTTASVLTNAAPNTNLYCGTFDVTNAVGQTVNYKFLMGGVWENNDVGPNGAQSRQFALVAGNQTLPVVYFDNLTNASGLVSTQAPFQGNLVGADLSMLAYFESQGTLYKAGGQAVDALEMLKGKGLNCVRLRLFTSSAAQAQADPPNYINNLDYTLPLAVRVKNTGLQLLLDFHYSDTWSDPGQQAVPAAWTNLTFTQLVQQMRTYNSNCIAAFKAAGAMPDFVQVGNEINGGMLWPQGRVGGSYETPAQWSQLGQLMNAAIQGIKDASAGGVPKLVVHVAMDWGGTKWYFDHLLAQQVQFDIIGESYYPILGGPLTNLATCLTKVTRRYNKPMIVAETSFPWASSVPTNIIGIPVGTNGQVQYVVALAQVVKKVPGGMVPGVFWWWTEYPGAWGSFFDSRVNVLPVADAFGQLAARVRLSSGWSGNNLTLRWPLSGAGTSLATAANLTGPWEWVTNTVQNIGTDFSVTLPVITNASCFYSLRSSFP